MTRKHNILKNILLFPLSLMYGFAVSFRNLLYDIKLIKHTEFEIPIISVGNITVGGTGKTPHTEFLIRLLQNDYKVAILSRGYKRKTSGFLEVNSNDTPAKVGDEALQVKLKFENIIVAVCEKRVIGIKNLLNLYPDINVIILDDAYQHRSVKPGLNILLNDYNNPIAEDHLLPVGRLREHVSATQRAHMVIVTKCPTNMKPIDTRIKLKELDVMPYQHVFFSKIKYLELKSLFAKKTDLLEPKNTNVLLITAIANSKPLYYKLQQEYKSITLLKFKDHHFFETKDLNKIINTFEKIDDPKCILCTEKDAVKLRKNENILEDISNKIFIIPIEVEIFGNQADYQNFNNQIISYVKNNKRINPLYSK